MATVGRGADQYTVRFPDGLRDRIKAAAEANNRSMNAEIVATLEEKYPEPKDLGLTQVIEDLLEMLWSMPKGAREKYVAEISASKTGRESHLAKVIKILAAATDDLREYSPEKAAALRTTPRSE